MGANRNFSIGELSRRAAVNIETIRYYEKIELLPPPARTEGGHRLYLDPQLKRLVFIRRSRELGFTLDEVRNLLGLVDGGHTCGEVKAAAVEHIQAIRKRISDLRRMERTLAATAACCEGGETPECPILDALFAAGPGGRRAVR